MNQDYIILRELASKYFELANSQTNLDRIKLHKAVNNLKPIRPIVLIGEIPWQEMNLDGVLDNHCVNEDCQGIETFFRRQIYQWENFSGDMILPPYFRVQKVINHSGIGLGRVNKDESEYQSASSHTFVDQLNEEEDLDKLHFDNITYDRQGTNKEFEFVANIFGDILPVRICGEPTGYRLGCKTWDDIVNLRGLDNLFYDMADRPEFIHRTVRKFTDIFLDIVRQYNQLELFDTDAYSCHSSSALTDDLHPDHSHPNSQGVWGRGLAQILASVSPSMHDEFDIQYMIEAMKPFGLVYYGCCEPLHNKIDIVSKIPHLRKISITPWADVDIAADCIQNKYVMSTKPNPATLAIDNLDFDHSKQELSKLLQAGKRNNCPQEILMKDITTVNNNPYNLFNWNKLAMEAVKNI